MKKSTLKIIVFFLLFCIKSVLVAQPVSNKSIISELQNLRKQLVPDNRVAILDFELKDTIKSIITVKGETDLPDAKSQIFMFLTANNIVFNDSLRVLPDTSLGDKIWALTTLSVSTLRFRPDNSTELVTQPLMGMPLKVLDFKNGWYRVQTPEKYIGWMESSGLVLLTKQELEKWNKSERWIYNDISGNIYDLPGKKGEVISDLVLGDIFIVENKTIGFLQIRMPDGRTGYVHRKHCISFDDWSLIKPEAKAIISVAKKMMGYPYLWGGTSAKATDCSGFVKIVFYSQGIILARDASQQARFGEPVDFNNLDKLYPADLIFFGRSTDKITHVGIYLGNGDFIHSSGRVHISSIVPGDPKYNPARNLVAARRILNSSDKEGIVFVKDHPWYN